MPAAATFNDSSFLPLNPPKAPTCFITGSPGPMFRPSVVALHTLRPRETVKKKFHDCRVNYEVQKRERKRAGKAAVTGGRGVCARFKPRKGSIPDVQG